MNLGRTAVALVLGALAAAPGDTCAAVARGERLELGATPGFILLGEGGRSTLRVPTQGERPVVSTNVGRLDAIRSGSGGVFEAELVPPDGVDPLVAIVAAATPTAFGWLAVPLHGTRELPVTGPRRGLVPVSVDGRSYGPVQVDDRGNATIRVDVPPGVRHATVGGRRVELPVPRASFSHVALDHLELEASALGTVMVRTIVLSDRGQPVAGAAPRLEVSEGVVATPVEREPGVYEVAWQVPRGRVREARVTARFAKAPVATAVLRRVPGAPREAELVVDRGTVTAGEAEDLRVVGRVVDAAGNPIDLPARLVVSVRAGGVTRFVPEAVIAWTPTDGGYTGRVRVPPRAGRQELELRMIAAGGFEASRIIAVIAGAPAGILVQSEGELLADGRRHPLRVSFVDSNGNPSDAPAAPVLVASRGTVGPPALRSPGVYAVDYRPPIASSDYRDLVTARAGAITGQAELAVRASGSPLVLAPRAGWRVGSGGLSSPVGGGELAVWTRPLRASFGVVVGVERFGFSRSDDLRAGAASLQLRSEATFWGVDGALAWRRPAWRGMAWLAAGGGAVHGSTRAGTPGQADQWGEAWAPQAHASVAWGPRVGRGFPFAELRLGWQGDLGSGPVRGSMQTLTISAGYRLDVL